MRAAVHTAVGEPLVIENLTLGPLRPHDVVVRVGASGVCHSDLDVQQGKAPLATPVVLGHEGAGVVEEVGPAETRVKVGDRVIGSISPHCGCCFFCLEGQSHLCSQARVDRSARPLIRPDGTGIGRMAGLGTFAELMVVTERAVVRVDTELPAAELALIGCGVMTGVGAAFNTAPVTAGSHVAVIGCGGVGQAVIQGARIAGAAEIYALDPVAMKRSFALVSGATHAIDPTEVDPATAVRELTKGRGADFVYEAVGEANSDRISEALQMTRHGGTCVMLGMAASGLRLELGGSDFGMERRLMNCIHGSANFDRDVPLLVELAEAGRLDLASLVTRTCSLDEINDALRLLETGEVIRSVITPF
jgi:S-(hydroxymethyl)glutathione dehydrogenase/alcohol dehydrogenase